MLVTIAKSTSNKRRQRWSFTLAPVAENDEGLSLVLSEYAVEVLEGARWVRPKLLFYRRRGGHDAAMPLREVPRLDDDTRFQLLAKLNSKVQFVAQSDDGLTRV